MTAPEPIVLSIDLPVPPERAFECFAPLFARWWPVATHSLSRDAATAVRMQVDPAGAIQRAHQTWCWNIRLIRPRTCPRRRYKCRF